ASSTFNGKTSYAKTNLNRLEFPFGEELALQIRTRQKRCSILLIQFYTVDGSRSGQIELALFTGLLQVYSSFSSGTATFQKDLSDGVWHYVYWKKEGDDLVINVDDERQRLLANFKPYSQNLNTTVTVHIGAKPFSP
ncbi:hypothetical protein LOTGIDRAFT_177016, partial [Lottia gigantea]